MYNKADIKFYILVDLRFLTYFYSGIDSGIICKAKEMDIQF